MNRRSKKSILSQFAKKHGTGSLVMTAQSLQLLRSSIVGWIDAGSEEINAVLGDRKLGIPGGRILEIFSQESYGKSTLAYCLLALYQARGGLGFLADIEGAFREDWARMLGVDVDNLFTIQLLTRNVKGKPVLEGMEDLFQKIADVIDVVKTDYPDKPALIVWDSVSATPTREELKGEFGDSTIAVQARAMSFGLRKLYGALHSTCITLLCISQLRTKIGSWFATEDTPGGKALKFYASIRAEVKRIGKEKDNIECKLINRKNKLGPPFAETHFRIHFAKGVTWF